VGTRAGQPTSEVRAKLEPPTSRLPYPLAGRTPSGGRSAGSPSATSRLGQPSPERPTSPLALACCELDDDLPATALATAPEGTQFAPLGRWSRPRRRAWLSVEIISEFSPRRTPRADES